MTSRNSVVGPLLLIALVAGLISVALPPLAETGWAEGIRASLGARGEREELPSRLFMTVAPFIKEAVLIGIPALATLAALRIARSSTK